MSSEFLYVRVWAGDLYRKARVWGGNLDRKLEPGNIIRFLATMQFILSSSSAVTLINCTYTVSGRYIETLNLVVLTSAITNMIASTFSWIVSLKISGKNIFDIFVVFFFMVNVFVVTISVFKIHELINTAFHEF